MTLFSNKFLWDPESSTSWDGENNKVGKKRNYVEKLEEQNAKKKAEEKLAMKNYAKKEDKLKVEVESKAEKRERVYKKINFNLKESSVPENWSSLVKRLKEKYKNDNSLEGTLLNNPQIQNILARIVGRYENERDNITKKKYSRKKEKNDKLIEKAINQAKTNNQNENSKSESWGKTWENIEENKEEKVDEIKTESREEFALRESTRQKFENWLLSKDWVRALMNILDDHIDENWNLYEKYPISEKDLELKLEKAWITHLRSKYNSENHLDNQDDKSNKKELNEVWKTIQDGVNKAVKNHMLNEWTEFDWNMIKQLESCIWQEGNFLQELKENPDKRDEFKCYLREYIKNYANLVLVKEGGKIVDAKLETWNDQIDLQLKSYLFIYWKTFLSENFHSSGTDSTWHEYDESLLDTLRIILSEDYEEIERRVKNKKLLEQEKKEEEYRVLRDYLRRQDAARRNREYNNRYNSSVKWIWWKLAGQKDTGDGSSVTWVQLASRINLDDYKSQWNIWEAFLNSDFAKEKAFNIAWKKFKESNRDIGIEDILTPEDMGGLYNIQWNSIIFDEDARKEFLKSDIIPPEKIDIVYNRLKTFPNDFLNALKIIGSWIDMKEKVIDDHVKTHALWAVIDNVRYIFADIEKKWENMVDKWKWDSKFKWFKFDQNNPVIREWDDIIMSGTFNWTDIKIRYDLTSWNLYMNSFLHYDSPSKVSIWNTNEADLQIWHLGSFDSILNEYYQSPELSFSSSSPTKNRWSHSIINQNSGSEQWSLNWWNSWDGSEEGNKKLIHIANHQSNSSDEQHTPAISMPDVNVSSSSGAQAVKHSTSNTWKINRWELEALRKKYSDMLNADIDMIGNMIMDNTKMQSAKNSSITKFLKTFNILWYSWWFENVDFNEGSNLFRLVKIIDYTGDKQPNWVDTLDYFENTFMPKAMEYSWLKWWENNINQDKSKDLFTKNDNNETTNILKSKIDNFNPNLFEWVWNFDSSHQLWFIDLITDNLLDESQNTLDMKKMEDFTSALGGQTSA